MKRVRNFLADNTAWIFILLVLAMFVSFVVFGSRADDGTYTFDKNPAKFSESQKRALCEARAETDKGIAAMLGVDVPQDASSGCEPTNLAQMGASVYYSVDVSSPAAFYNAVNGRGFNEGYGYQCVAGFKEFMFALSGKYVATKTGGASGYASQQAQIEPLGFKWHGGASGLQDGDWGIFGGGQYGHVAMRYQGKWFGQNQGAANASAGNPFNLLGYGTENLIGYYRPNIYQKAAPAPSPSPSQNTGNPGATSSTGNPGSAVVSSYTVQRGDTLGSIALRNGWYGSSNGLYGNSGYTQQLAELNSIQWRGLILPGQVIRRAE